MVITNIGGQEDGFALDIVSGNVTDDTGEAVDGMWSLDVALCWTGEGFGRHGVSVRRCFLGEWD